MPLEHNLYNTVRLTFVPDKIGLEEGRKEGLKAGEQRLSQLIQALLHAGRTEDMQLALSNPEYREKLYREYNL